MRRLLFTTCMLLTAAGATGGCATELSGLAFNEELDGEVLAPDVEGVEGDSAAPSPVAPLDSDFPPTPDSGVFYPDTVAPPPDAPPPPVDTYTPPPSDTTPPHPDTRPPVDTAPVCLSSGQSCGCEVAPGGTCLYAADGKITPNVCCSGVCRRTDVLGHSKCD